MNEELRIIITAEIDKLKTELEKGKKETEKFSKKGKEAFSEFNDGVQKAGDVSKKALGIAATAIAGAATALLALSASTKDYRQAQAKLTTAFEAAGATAETAKDTYNDLFRVLGDTDKATEAASHLAKLTNDEKELAEWTKACQGIYATFGDSLPIESLTEAANETAKVGTITGALADALNWAGISEDDFNAKLEKCNTEAQREKLIRETLNGVYSNAANMYEENAADILAANEAQGKLNDTTAKLGEALQPVNTLLTELGTEVLAELTPYIQEFAEKHLPKVKEVLTNVAKAIGDVIGWIANNWELVSTLAIVIGAISAALSVFATVMGIVNAVMLASPVTWIVLAIVAAVAALVAIIVLVIKYWDEIAAAAGKAWEWIKGIWEAVATWFNDNVVQPLVKFFTAIWDAIVAIFTPIIDFYKGIFEAIWNFLEPIVNNAIVIVTGCWEIIKKVFSIVASWFNEKVIQPVAKFFGGMWDGLTSGASKAWEGIKSVFSKVANFFGDVFSKAWSKVKAIFSVGGKIFDGIKDGIVNAFKTVVNAIIKGINKVVAVPFNAINKVITKIKGIEIVGITPFKNLSNINVPQIPLLAKGGIVDSATLAVVGEQGKEAIVPLENNTEWITKMANMLANRLGSVNTPIALYVDGKVFAETAINTLNQRTIQTGKLDLVLA